MKRIAFILSILVGTALTAQTTFAATWIGKTAVVRKFVTGQLGPQRRNLKRGDSVFANELIRTGNKSRTQVLFRDETVLTVGADSSVLIDKFVYDPNRTKSQVVLNTFKGSFRFITGSAPSRSYRIKTPVASIGIRGTIVNWTYDGVELRASVAEGAVRVCIPSGRCIRVASGWFVVTNGRTMRTGRGRGTRRADLDITDDPIGTRFSGAPRTVPTPSTRLPTAGK